MRRDLSLVLLPFAAVIATPSLAQESAIFMCRFQHTVGGVQHDESSINLLVEQGADGSLATEIDDPTLALSGLGITGLEGDLSSSVGERRLALTARSSGVDGYLLTIGSSEPPRRLNGGPEILVGMLGEIASGDPRQGQCLMMPGAGAREVFERLRSEGANQ